MYISSVYRSIVCNTRSALRVVLASGSAILAHILRIVTLHVEAQGLTKDYFLLTRGVALKSDCNYSSRRDAEINKNFFFKFEEWLYKVILDNKQN